MEIFVYFPDFAAFGVFRLSCCFFGGLGVFLDWSHLLEPLILLVTPLNGLYLVLVVQKALFEILVF